MAEQKAPSEEALVSAKVQEDAHARAVKIALSLLGIDALRFSASEPYRWSSGWLSPVYCDNRLTLSYPDVRDEIVSGFEAAVAAFFPGGEIVCGVATGGVPHGVLLADRLRLPFIYVRGAAKSHGLGNQIEGKLEPGRKVVVIEDLISTGGSSMLAISALREAGMEVVGLISIFSYEFEQARTLFENNHIRYHSLTTLGTLLEVAQANKTLEPQVVRRIREWRRDPQLWQGEAGGSR